MNIFSSIQTRFFTFKITQATINFTIIFYIYLFNKSFII